MKHIRAFSFLRAAGFLLAALALLLSRGAASAQGAHTAVVRCGGGGFVGIVRSQVLRVALAPETHVASADGKQWTLEDLRRAPGFHLEGAALRFTVTEAEGTDLLYTLFCGNLFSLPQRVLEGCNLWDITDVFAAWLESPRTPLSLAPMHELSESGFQVREGSVSIQLTFSASAGLPLFPLDRVRDQPFYEAALSMLEEGNPFIDHYDDTAGSLLTASLPLGVPYYYAGRTEEKILRRFYPQTITRYYRPDRMYFGGLD